MLQRGVMGSPFFVVSSSHENGATFVILWLVLFQSHDQKNCSKVLASATIAFLMRMYLQARGA
jgi:hypothetical protein